MPTCPRLDTPQRRALLRALAAGAALLAVRSVPAFGEDLEPWRGGPTPPLDLEDPQRVRHRLTDYRDKVVLVNFWATWCEPCRDEMPSIEQLRRSLEDKPFAVLGVNVGEGARAVRSFAEKASVRFPLLLDRDRSATRGWGVRVLPATFVVGPEGRVRFTRLGGLDWSSASVRAQIESLMAARPPATARVAR